MATSKTPTEIWSSQTLTAGAGDTTSSWIDLTDSYGASVHIRITNGATGPTVATQVQVEVCFENAASTAVDFGGPLIASTTNSAVTEWVIRIGPEEAQHVRLVAGSNTAQDVTIDADTMEVTKI